MYKWAKWKQYLGLSALFVILFEQMRAWGRTEHVIQNTTEMTDYWLQCSHIHTQIKLVLMSMNDHFCDYIHSGVWNVPRAVNKNTVINCAQAVQPSSVQITVISEMRLDLTQITSPFSIHITSSNQWTSCDEQKCAGLSLH